MVAISQLWYYGSYTIAAKPIKMLESHYSMIQFLIITNIHVVMFYNKKRGDTKSMENDC